MDTEYPQDADGDALRRVAGGGADLSQPMVIDFAVAVADEATARRVAEIVAAHDFDPSISQDDGRDSWSVYCSKSMLATYEGVVAVRAQLNALLGANGGVCDGWATFGNHHG